jgi:hypothetical protein
MKKENEENGKERTKRINKDSQKEVHCGRVEGQRT